MTAFVGDSVLSAAGIDQGHRAFQEFLLAGERHLVAGLSRPGAEEAFARTYASLPNQPQDRLNGYFRRQAMLDLSQRAAILGPFVKLNIEDALVPGVARKITPPSATIRSELDSLGERKFDGRGGPFKTVRGSVLDAAAAAGKDERLAPAPKKRGVRFIDLLLKEVTIEKSQDESWFKNDTDEPTLGLVMLDETGSVTTAKHDLEPLKEGKTKKFTSPLTLGSIAVDTTIQGFPRSFYFKVDAVERDDGGYNDALKAGADYIQEKVTQELIAAGLIKGGAKLGIPIPPFVANYVASYLKTWFDDFVDWFVGLFKDNDDLLGSKTRQVVLNSYDFELTESTGIFGMFEKTVRSANGPLLGSPFRWTYSGAGGRWRTQMQVQLR